MLVGRKIFLQLGLLLGVALQQLSAVAQADAEPPVMIPEQHPEG